MIERVYDNLGLWLRKLIADAGEGSAEMLAWLIHDRDIEPHIPVFDKSNCSDGTLSRADFAYDMQANQHEEDWKSIRKPGLTMSSDVDLQRGRRLLFIDNLRWSAIAMVVVIHAAVTYSGFGSWYVYDRLGTSRPALISLATYQSLQHAVAMGLLFGIAGYFASRSLDRRTIGGFLAERARRLGLPLMAYMFVIGPLTEYYISRSWSSTPSRGFGAEWLNHVADGSIFSGSGPLWFCLVLLVFSLCFALTQSVPAQGRPITRNMSSGAVPTPVAMSTFALGIAMVTFAVGVVAPHGPTVLNVVVLELPQYPLMFIAGVLAHRNDWLLRFPAWYGPAGLVGGLAGGLVSWFALLTLGGAFHGHLADFRGGWHWQAAMMDLWRSFTCIALSVGLITLYRDHLDRQNRLTRFLTANAFGVYIFHPPILIAITRVLHDVPADNLVKFAIASLAAVGTTFVFVGFIARRMPVVRALL